MSALLMAATGRGKLRVEATRAAANWRALGLLTATTGLMQLTSLWTFTALPVGNSLALFQTSTLVTVVLGRRFFNEQHFWNRMIGSGVMVVGAVLVVTGK
jgi:drug/metabolite transporter (DMT)-like permease